MLASLFRHRTTGCDWSAWNFDPEGKFDGDRMCDDGDIRV